MIPYWHYDNVPGPRPKYFSAYDDAYLGWWEEFLHLLGEEFDGHPLLEYADISGYGFWGEGHHYAMYSPEGRVANYQPGGVDEVEAIAARLVRNHLEAFPKTPAVLNIHMLEYEAGRAACERDGLWLRRDSFLPWMPEAEIAAALKASRKWPV